MHTVSAGSPAHHPTHTRFVQYLVLSLLGFADRVPRPVSFFCMHVVMQRLQRSVFVYSRCPSCTRVLVTITSLCGDC